MSYHHGNLRSALIETAANLARAKGVEGVVLREVARQTGVSHNAAYRHFADREELLTAVADQAMADLASAMRQRIAALPDTDARTRAVLALEGTGRAYVDFALAEPGLFEVAFAVFQNNPTAVSPASPVNTVSTAEAETSSQPPSDADPGPYEILGQSLDELVRVGLLAPERRDGAQILCWSAVHGFAVLHVRGPLVDAPTAEREAALDAMLSLVTRGLVGDLA